MAGNSGQYDSPIDDLRNEEFFKVFMANQNKIYTFILMLVPNSVDADDIMQESAAIMWKKFDNFQPGTDFAAWGIHIARYRAFDFIRKNHTGRLTFSTETVQAISDYIEQTAITDDPRLDVLKSCLKKLPENERNLINMRYARAMTVKSIAERIGRSVHGLYKSMARIHNVLLDCVHKTLAAENMP